MKNMMPICNAIFVFVTICMLFFHAELSADEGGETFRIFSIKDNDIAYSERVPAPLKGERFFGVNGLDYVFHLPGFSSKSGAQTDSFKKYIIANTSTTKLSPKSQFFLKIRKSLLFIIAGLIALLSTIFIMYVRRCGDSQCVNGKNSIFSDLGSSVFYSAIIGGVFIWAVASIDGLFFSPSELFTEIKSPSLYIDNATSSEVEVLIGESENIIVPSGNYVYIYAGKLKKILSIKAIRSGNELEAFTVTFDPKKGTTYFYNIMSVNEYGVRGFDYRKL